MDRIKAVEDIVRRDRGNMVRFLRDIISMPSPSAGEGKVAARTVKEMKRCGFQRSFVDRIGNAVGIMGTGRPVILFDAHMDTVGIHEKALWKIDPYRGKEDREFVYGRGAAENKGALASIIYGLKAMREAGLCAGTAIVTGSVFEEDCDGLGLWYALRYTGLKPDAVVIGKFTGLRIMRGQRGRMEIRVTVPGKSCHASVPEEGINPIYAATGVISGIEKLDKRLKRDKFLGKGTIAVTQISVKSPGFNRLGHEVYLSIDRRLTAGETKSLALRQIRSIPAAKGSKIEVLTYEKPASTGLVQKVEKYFPGWSMPAGHPLVKAACTAYRSALGRAPVIDKWTVSSNGVASCGAFGIPTIGFGPGEKEFIHNYNDRIRIDDMMSAAKFYAVFPGVYAADRGR